MIRLVLITGAALGLIAASPAPLDNAAMSASLMRLAKFKPVDAFDAGPDFSALVAAPFRLSIPLKDGNVIHEGVDTSGFWVYDAAAQELRFNMSPDEIFGIRADDDFDHEDVGYTFGGERIEGKPYAAQNGYGARVEVTPLTVTYYMVYVRAPKTDLDHDQFEIKLSVAPAEARAIATHSALVISGVLGDQAGPARPQCPSHLSDATADSPTKLLLRKCAARASRLTAAVVRTDNGQVLMQHDFATIP
jgi:hypothetical protein